MPHSRAIILSALTLVSAAGLATAEPGSCGAGKTYAQQPACSGGSNAEARHESPATIAQVASNAPNFKTLVKAAEAAGLIDTLNSEGPFTIFAPTDEAFAKVDKNALADLLKPENREKLRNVLLYHVVSGKVESGAAVKLTSATAVNGQRLDVMFKNNTLTIDGAKVIAADVGASNGVIHAIDTVMMPAQENLVGTAAAAGKFKTLLAAAKAAGLADALGGKDALTVLAPTDDAFAKLPAGTVESLLKPENKDQLKKILSLHVIPGRVYSDQVVKLTSAKSIDGQTLTPMVKDGAVSINGSKVVKTDIEATNGVVHVIDTVILPK